MPPGESHSGTPLAGINHEGIVRYEPNKGFIADGVPDYPVGTPDELQAHGLPAKVFQSCAEPDPDGNVAGCPCWHECAMSYKGLPSDKGGGPRAHCWELMKSAENGGGIVRTAAPCFWGVARLEEAYENKAVLRTIADEGEEYEMLTTVPDPSGGRDQNGAFKWDTMLLKLRVPRFQRLGEEQKLARHELRSSIMQRDKERLRNERAAKVVGSEVAGEPLDKRGKRSVSSPAKEG